MPEIRVMAGAQSEFVESTAPYPAYIAGRRGGKTSASVIKMVKYVQEHPGAYGMYTMPTLGDVEKYLLPKMHEFFGEGYGSLWGWLEKKAQLVFPGFRATVFVRPAAENPESCRGPTLAFAAMDEIGTDDQERAFHILEPAVSQKGYPHQLWVTSTPNVERPWIKKLWQDKVNPLTNEPVVDPDEYPLFRARTIDNWHLDQSVKDRLYRSFGTSREAQQELEGQFISVEGLAFEMLDESKHVRYPPDVQWKKIGVAGFDPGGTDPTALIEWRQAPNLDLYAVSEFYKRNADAYDWVGWCQERNIMQVRCDPTGTSEKQVDEWRRAYKLNIQRASAMMIGWSSRKDYWREKLTLRCPNHAMDCTCPHGRPQVYISPDCPNLWAELQNLAQKKTRAGEWQHEWSAGCSDHAYDAGVYGMDAFRKFEFRPVTMIKQVVAA